VKKPVMFLLFWILNSVLVYLAALTFPEVYVLGTFRLTVMWAAVVSGFFWTLLVWVEKKFAKKFGLKFGKPSERILFYIVANFVAIWLVARFAPYTGFGLASFLWAFGLGVVGSLVQFVVWRMLRRK